MSTSFSQSGWTALFHACWGGKTEVVRELLQRQADVNIPSEVSLSLGYPPLVLHTCPLFQTSILWTLYTDIEFPYSHEK